MSECRRRALTKGRQLGLAQSVTSDPSAAKNGRKGGDSREAVRIPDAFSTIPGPSMKLEFKGVFPAPPTPTTEDGRVNEKALRALLDDNISHGCGGFWMAGQHRRRADPHGRAARRRCKNFRGSLQGTRSGHHAGGCHEYGQRGQGGARPARAAGCAAVCCLPPLFFRSSERSIIDYYKAVADAAGDLPFFVYNLPQLTQIEFFPAMMEKLKREIPTLKGLKHSAPDFTQIRLFADMGLELLFRQRRVAAAGARPWARWARSTRRSRLRRGTTLNSSLRGKPVT